MRSVSDWWYFIPETGQHVSLYTRESLEYLAERFGLRLCTDGVAHHILTRRPMNNPFRPRIRWAAVRGVCELKNLVRSRTGSGLLERDFELTRQRVSQICRLGGPAAVNEHPEATSSPLP